MKETEQNLVSLIDKAFLLKRVKLFCSLDMDFLLAISEKTEVSSYKKGDGIFRKDQAGNRLYIISEGIVEIKTEDKKDVFSIWELKSPECFGDESLINENPRGYEATAKTSTKLLSLNKIQFLHILEECSSVSLALLEVYTAKTTFRRR
ncbi:MAG: cyclic nucleotide-binding domain-containing protein [Victivallaceae bacterium]